VGFQEITIGLFEEQDSTEPIYKVCFKKFNTNKPRAMYRCTFDEAVKALCCDDLVEKMQLQRVFIRIEPALSWVDIVNFQWTCSDWVQKNNLYVEALFHHPATHITFAS